MRAIAAAIGLTIAMSSFAQPFDGPEAAAEAFLFRMVDGKFGDAERQFDDVMRSSMPGGSLERSWKQIVTANGVFKEILSTRREYAGMFHIVIFTCAFDHGRFDVKIVLNNGLSVSGLWFLAAEGGYETPPYADLAKFSDREVSVGSGEWVLPGTLTMPVGDGPFPAAVLVHGSGPQDRDETIGANKPFRDLAWGLAAKGVAVLRYEKRTKHYQDRLIAFTGEFTVNDETVDDAASAVNVLRMTPGVDNNKVFIIGHSMGGTFAPRIAIKNPAAAGLVIMAGSTRPIGEILIEQLNYIYGLDGDISEDEHLIIETTKRQVAMIYSDALTKDTPQSALPFGAPASYWLDFRSYDPIKTAAEIDRPMLILQGGRDYQVTQADFDGWRVGLKGRKDIAFQHFPNLNHLFISGEGKSTPGEYAQPGHVDIRVIDRIAEWIAER